MKITPLLPDGYSGPIKQLTCRICKHVFYITMADYNALADVFYCHGCSLILAEELEKSQGTQSEMPPQQHSALAPPPPKPASMPPSSSLHIPQAQTRHRENTKRRGQSKAEEGNSQSFPDELHKFMAEMVLENYMQNIKHLLKEEKGKDISEHTTLELAIKLIKKDQRRGIDPFWKGWGVYTEENMKLDDQGRVVLHVFGNTITENIYSHDSDAEPVSTRYDLSTKDLRETRPDLVEWATSVKQKEQEKRTRERKSRKKT